MGNIKAILFDLDGVLIDAKDWHYEALNKALTVFGLGISRYEHLKFFDGLPTKEKLNMLSQERGLPRGLHPFINELKQKYTLEEIDNKCKPLFSHEYALSRLKQNKYLLGVCSNSIRKSVQIALEKAMLKDFFDLLLSAEDVQHPKPNPEIYLTAMKTLCVRPSETLVLEDNDHGIRAARESGAHVFEITGIHDVTYEKVASKIHFFEQNHS